MEVDLFDFLRQEELRRLWFDLRLGGDFAGEPEGRPMGPRWQSRRLLAGLMAMSQGESRGGWRLLVRHPESSLEVAVDRTRRRNLAVGSAVLLLLAATLTMLVASSRRAQRLARQQVEFVAGVSHELRTPVAAIGSLGQNLADGLVEKPEQVRRYGTLIHREGQRLTRMVEQVLEFSGVLARKPSDLRATPATGIVRGAIVDSRALVEEHGFRLTAEVPADLPAVAADGGALRRAIVNLIKNVVKYGRRDEEGGEDSASIEVRSSRLDGPRGGEVAIAVADRGQGIEAADLPRVFEPFYRGRQATEAQIEGSGLGLSLVKHTAEAHGGRIDVESEAGKGSIFTLRIPALEDEDVPSDPAD